MIRISWHTGLVLSLLLALAAPPASVPTTVHAATTFTVNSTLDVPDVNPGDGICSSGPPRGCTLRAAIMEANALPGADTISVPSGRFELARSDNPNSPDDDTGATGDLDILESLTINGAGPSSTIVIGRMGGRIFDVPRSSIDVTITGLTATKGFSAPPGAGIRNVGTLMLRDVALTENDTPVSGAGLYNVGSVTLIDVTVEANFAYGPGLIHGGSILNDGSLTAMRLVLRRNVAGSSRGAGIGGGIDNRRQATLTDSVVDGNEGVGIHNGIFGGMGGASLTLNRVLVSNNDIGILNTYGTVNGANLTVAGNRGSGINSRGSIELSNATITDSRTAAGTYALVAWSGTARLKSTLVFRADGNTCAGEIISLGNNIDSGDRCAFHAPGDQINVDPKLGPLANNGGFSLTHALMPGSPAIDRGADAVCHVTDQRGAPRPRDGNGDGSATCDIGAFELQTSPTSVVCAPRPPIRVAVGRNHPGALLATITAPPPAGISDGAPDRPRALRIGRVTNATVDAGGQTGLGANQTVTLPEGTSQTSIVVHRGPNGPSATVELVVVDDCGEWRTFVGGGPGGF